MAYLLRAIAFALAAVCVVLALILGWGVEWALLFGVLALWLLSTLLSNVPVSLRHV